MGLTKYKLGELIKLSDERNTEGRLGIESVRGISNAKEIMTTKADVDENVIRKFYIVRPNEFIYNPRTTRMGDKVGLAYNNTDIPLLFSFNNIAFSIKDSARELILPHYLYMFFNRSEFDRYAIVHSWGSATELFSFEEMCDIDITIPNISQQRKYVDVYLALQKNLAAYQSKVEELKLVCDGYIERLRQQLPCEKIGKYIESTDRKTDNTNIRIQGISNQRRFIDSDSRTAGVDKEKYIRIDPREFGYSPIHINDGSIAFNDSNESYLLSPIYKTFKVVDENKLHPEYLMMWFLRDEFIRYCWFHAFGSARDCFEWEKMIEVQIPVPDLNVQKSIANISKVFIERQRIDEQLKAQLKSVCSILIKGSLQN